MESYANTVHCVSALAANVPGTINADSALHSAFVVGNSNSVTKTVNVNLIVLPGASDEIVRKLCSLLGEVLPLKMNRKD